VLDPLPSRAEGVFFNPDSDCMAVYLCGHEMIPAGLVKPIGWWFDSLGSPSQFNLPTLGGGEGNARAFILAPPDSIFGGGCTGPIFPWEFPFGPWGTPIIIGSSLNGAMVRKAVTWQKDENGIWVIQALPHPTMGSAGDARFGTAIDESTAVVGGFAENAAGQMRPQLWKAQGAGPWVRTELPLLAGGTGGAALGAQLVCNGITTVNSVSGWSSDGSGTRTAVLWEETSPSQWSVTSLGVLAGKFESEASNAAHFISGEFIFIYGTSYNTTPEIDGLATLWEEEKNTVVAYDVNSLVTADRVLLASVVEPPTTFVSPGRAYWIGVGRPLSTSKASASGTTQHALLLIEDNVTGVTPPANGFPAHLWTSPNPFNGSTSVTFSLARPGHAIVSVYDVEGRRVATLADGSFAAGSHKVRWPAQDAVGDLIGPGVYLLRLEASGVVTTQKVVQIR